MSKKSKHRYGIYYSSDDSDNQESAETLPPSEQRLKVWIDRKKRKGKEVTLITGFIGSKDDLDDLARTLKKKCGVGGGAKDGEILIQGNHRKKVLEILTAMDFQAKSAGGN